MAGIATVTFSSGFANAPRLLHLRQQFLGASLSFLYKQSFSMMGFNGQLRQKRPNFARKLVIKAARTESKGVELGSRAPHFELPEPLTGKTWTLEDFEAYPALLVIFICNHCPFVIHLKKDIVKLANFYMKKGLAVVAISSNSAVTHPQTQEVAKDFGAVCTPEFFLFKKDGRRPFELVYHGQFDDSRPSNNVPVTGRDLSLAIDCVLSGQPVPSVQKPSIGCSIKWHPGRKL
ncbi:OLC1v1016645C2 [Oldenlandia corymbosa var. corymbosa]|uniref:glutaredoxin-dependent peroxiredoxin n=1 Tax=Oldenlandia corymbosa var. corymbosa TaxID=529605 RepID=A0AAV1E7L1_OLDCO|nr:OLC1v1016645C2 [Oldenlandia corymbosa var. corymbosa]